MRRPLDLEAPPVSNWKGSPLCRTAPLLFLNLRLCAVCCVLCVSQDAVAAKLDGQGKQLRSLQSVSDGLLADLQVGQVEHVY